MLLQTTKPILDVAVAAGFTSASHFSRCYRAAYGHKPSDERAAALLVHPTSARAGVASPLRRAERKRPRP
jgi:AraC-like DNA-binding protein